jgi:hypothetical protein
MVRARRPILNKNVRIVRSKPRRGDGVVPAGQIEAAWLPAGSAGAEEDGRPIEPRRVPVALLDAFCAAFPFSGFAEHL